MLFTACRVLFRCSVALWLTLLSNGMVLACKTLDIRSFYGKHVGSFSVNADGRYLAFLSSAGKTGPIFVYDRQKDQLGQITHNKTADYSSPVMSANGRYVAFWSADKHPAVLVYDRWKHTTDRIEPLPWHYLDSSYGYTLDISADGRFVAFGKDSDSVDSSGVSKESQMLLHDRLMQKTIRINRDLNGKPTKDSSSNIALSSDGRYLVFSSYANNLVKGDTNYKNDIFIYDYFNNKIERIEKLSTELIKCNCWPSKFRISANGRYIAFLTYPDAHQANTIFYDRNTQQIDQFSTGVAYEDNFTLNMSADGHDLTYGFNIYNTITHKKTEIISQITCPILWHGWEDKLSADGRLVFTKRFDDYNSVSVGDRLLNTHSHADLKITLKRKPSYLKPNSKGIYQYSIINKGPNAATDVSLIYIISGGRAIALKPSQGKCSTSPVESVCRLGKLASGKSLTLQVSVRTQFQSFDQQLSANAAPIDVTPGNNQFLVTTEVRP